MKHALIAAALLGALAMPAVAGGSGHAGKMRQGAVAGPVIVASCYRGPWHEVIWDRPNPEFIDSLIAAGYDHPTALAIGERICEDQSIVGKPDEMRAEAIKVLRAAPAN